MIDAGKPVKYGDMFKDFMISKVDPESGAAVSLFIVVRDQEIACESYVCA